MGLPRSPTKGMWSGGLDSLLHSGMRVIRDLPEGHAVVGEENVKRTRRQCQMKRDMSRSECPRNGAQRTEQRSSLPHTKTFISKEEGSAERS